GMEVDIHYDPLLAKLIAYGADRETALRKIVYALKNLRAQGVQTNREFLISVLEQSEFRGGKYHTGFVDEHLRELTEKDPSEDFLFTGVVALYLQKQLKTDATALPKVPMNYRNNPFRDPSVKLQIDGEVFDVSWRPVDEETFAVSCRDWQANMQLVSFERGSIRVSLDGILRAFQITEGGDQFFVQSPTASRILTRLSRYPRAQTASEHESAFAPMPGQVLRILVEVGQRVSAGDPLVILEAMKMEQTLRATADGIVDAVLVKQGDVVAPGDTLVGIAPLTKDKS